MERYFTEKASPRPAHRLRSAMITLIVILGIIVGFLGSSYITANTAGNNWEESLNRQYTVCEGKLSSYYTDVQAAIGATSANAATIEKIDALTRDAVVNGGSTAALANPNNRLYLMLYQAWPNTGGVTQTYHDLETIMIGKFDDYRSAENDMDTMLAQFDAWRLNTALWNPFVKGYPDANLHLTLGGYTQPITGGRAEAIMWSVVADATTEKALQSGTLPTLTVPTP